jgi:hypothetical protein
VAGQRTSIGGERGRAQGDSQVASACRGGPHGDLARVQRSLEIPGAERVREEMSLTRGGPPVIERKHGTRGWRVGPTRHCPRVWRAGARKLMQSWLVGVGLRYLGIQPSGGKIVFFFLFISISHF